MIQSALIIAVLVAIPPFAVVLSSREGRSLVRGKGSILQTLSNAGCGVVFLIAQTCLRGGALALVAGASAMVPWKLDAKTPLTWLLSFVVLDFIYYCQHRLEHHIPILWAIHAVHHQSRDYNLSVSFRLGALTSISTGFFHVPIALLGVTPTMYAGSVAVHGALLFTLHARTRFALGPGRLFNAPVFHRVHHGAESVYINRNFGGVLLVFDRIFGTFAPQGPEPTFGVVDQPSPHNPVEANLAPWASLARKVRLQPTLRGKFRVLFVESKALSAPHEVQPIPKKSF